jgi:ABC-type lipoprotein release transport system permease subunit
MLIAIVGVLALVALLASIVPVRRATRLEPTTALRIE